ncbi:hypothetical protein BJ878DRAFT_491014 [Calycina marina]|uniref:Uncharacterized protein n=1 Tax=Calycina marina TaxID=1763456 RepID=A0A9P7Z9J1_9HELO|nr:hypothetical protein BJ878DRAFT_491014 [Calycina marina]
MRQAECYPIRPFITSTLRHLNDCCRYILRNRAHPLLLVVVCFLMLCSPDSVKKDHTGSSYRHKQCCPDSRRALSFEDSEYHVSLWLSVLSPAVGVTSYIRYCMSEEMDDRQLYKWVVVSTCCSVLKSVVIVANTVLASPCLASGFTGLPVVVGCGNIRRGLETACTSSRSVE